MNISGYGVAGAISGYGTQYISQTSSKSFTIPIWGENMEKTEDTPITTYKDPFVEMAQTGNVTLPEWMDTKMEPTRSDEEILKELIELAREHAKSERPARFEDKKYTELIKEYVAPVSPDRAGILSKSTQEVNGMINAIYGTNYSFYDIYRQLDSQRADKTDEEDKEKKNKELIDYFLEALKSEGRYNDVAIDMDNDEIIGTLTTIIKSDMYVGVIENGVVQSMEFFDPTIEQKSNEYGIVGNSVMMYRDGKFLQALRPEECTRRAQAFATYEAAYDFAVGDRSRLEHYSEAAKEAYNSTYDRLTNGVIA